MPDSGGDGGGALEWTIASRYVKSREKRSARLYLIALPFVLVGLLCWGTFLYLHMPHARMSQVIISLLPYSTLIRNGVLFSFVIAWVLAFLVLLIRSHTVFTSISTFGLFLGSFLLVVAMSVMSGFEQDLKQKILGANAHILVTSPDAAFTDYEQVAARVRKLPGVESVTPYLSNEVMISSQANLAGVILTGIDPASATGVTDLSRNMEQGSLDDLVHPERVQPSSFLNEMRDKKPRRPLDELAPPEPSHAAPDAGAKAEPKLPPAPIAPIAPAAKDEKVEAPVELKPRRKVLPGVIVGRELAKNLRLYLGDEVNIISPMGDIGPTGSMPRSRPFRVVGIFFTGMYEYDTKRIYMSIPAAQKFLGMPDEVTGVEVRIVRPDDTEPVDEAIRQAIAAGGSAQYEVQDWKELNRSLFTALKIEKIAMFIALCFIILVAGFAIVATGVMLVREKERDIAMLKSMGARDERILRTFLYIGAYIGLVGIGTGIGTGVVACLLLRYVGITLDSDVYYIARLPVDISAFEIAAVVFVTMTIALAAMLYPAFVAARLRPVEGLRFDHG